MAHLKYAPKRRKPIALDFDGVLHSFKRGYTGAEPKDDPVPGAQEFTRWLLRNGWEPHVFTARATTEGRRQAVQRWLAEHGFPRLRVTNEKEPAEVYIDDRAMRFTGRFDQIMRRLQRGTLPWHRKH